MKMHRRADESFESGATEPMQQQNESKMNSSMQHGDTNSNIMESSMMSQEESKGYTTGMRAFNILNNKNSKSGRIRNSDDDFIMQKHASKSPTEALSTKGRETQKSGKRRRRLNSPERQSKNYLMSNGSRRMKIRQLSDSQYTENDKVSLWEWSKGFSPAQNDQMTIAIMIREAQDETQYRQGSTGLHELVQPQVKVIRVTKKLLNNTVFVIFEDESPHFPMYRIVNSCRNVRIQLQQANMDEPKGSPEVIEFDQSMIFGLYEPENERKVKLDLEIDKNDFSSNTMYRKGEVVVQE